MTMQAHILRAAGAVANAIEPIPEFVSASSARGAGSFNITAPANIQNGDMLVALVMNNTRQAASSVPTGWNLIASRASAGPQIFTKIASSEPATYTFSFPAGNAAGIVLAYRGVDTVDAVGVFSDTNSADSITATKAGVLLAHFTVLNAAAQPAAPSGMTFREFSGGLNPSLAVFDLIPSGTGVSGAKNVTWSIGGSQNSVLVQVSK